MARVLVPLAQGCEELEAVTVIDLLRRAQIEVVTAALARARCAAAAVPGCSSPTPPGRGTRGAPST
jgi:putative intracellular protease/amidase